MGIAHCRAPTVLLCGDLAFLHDHAALLLAREMQGSLTIILLNNYGGGVFEHLPIAEHDAVYERYFATPQSIDLPKLCEAHRIEYHHILNWPTLEDHLRDAPKGIRLFEIKTNRQADRDCLASIFN